MGKVTDIISYFPKNLRDKLHLFTDPFSHLSHEDQNLVHVALLLEIEQNRDDSDPVFGGADCMNKEDIAFTRCSLARDIETLRSQRNFLFSMVLGMKDEGRTMLKNFDPENAFASLPPDVQDYLKESDRGNDKGDNITQSCSFSL